MSKFFKKGELQDKKIAAALRQAAEDYENGEIIEVKDVLIDIVNAITEFDQAQEECNTRHDTRLEPRPKLCATCKHRKKELDAYPCRECFDKEYWE